MDALRDGPSQPHPGLAKREPLPEECQARRGVAPGAQPVLVRGPLHGGAQLHGLTIDRREADALERILAGCRSTAMEPLVCHASTASEREADTSTRGNGDALTRYDDNRSGRITCKEARRHGIAPLRRGYPAYRYTRDGDGNGIMCE